MAKKDVVRLLVRLYGDPLHMEKLQRDPGKTLADSKLTPAERKLLLTHDPKKIRAYLGEEGAKSQIKSKTELGKIKAKAKATTAAIKAKASTSQIKSKFKK